MKQKITKIPNATNKIKLKTYILSDKMKEKYKTTEIIMEPQLKLYFQLVYLTSNRLKSCFTRDSHHITKQSELLGPKYSVFNKRIPIFQRYLYNKMLD